MKTRSTTALCSLLAVFLLVFSAPSLAGDPAAADTNTQSTELPKVKVTMTLEHEAFLMWYAKKMNFDREFGVQIDLEVVREGGMDIMTRLKNDRNAWNLTATSSIPLILGSRDTPIEVIGIANDESASTGLLVPPESNLFRVKGWNGDYPEVYGSPEMLEGKTFCIRNLSSSAYALAKYLEVFDLDFSDVVIKNTSTTEGIETTVKGDADGTVLWSPETYEAENAGLRSVNYAKQVQAEIPLLFMAERRFAKENSELVAKVLAAYIKAVEKQIEDLESLVKPYQQFLLESGVKDIDLETCRRDLVSHKVYDIEDQLPLFEKTGHRQSKIQKLEATLASSLMLILYDSMSQENFCATSANIKNPRYVTDRYLRIAQRLLEKNGAIKVSSADDDSL